MKVLKQNKLYRWFLVDSLVSGLGDSLYYIALLTYASQFSQASLAITIVSLSETLPYLFGLITGSLADISQHKVTKSIKMSIFRAGLYLLIGVMMGFQSTLNLLVGMASLNFISDIFGKYAGGLLTPFILYIVPTEQLEEAQGLNGALGQLLIIVAKFFGAFLLGSVSFQVLAWLNSVTFLVSALILFSLRPALRKIEQDEFQRPTMISLKTIGQQTKQSLQAVVENKSLFRIILVFALANALLTAIDPLISIAVAKNSRLIWQNFPVTLAIIQGLLSFFLITGSLASSQLVSRYTLNQLCLGLFASLFLFAGGVLVQMRGLLLLGAAFTGLLVGLISPKFNALLLTQVAHQQVATVVGGVNMILMTLPSITTVFFTALASLINFNLALVCLVGLIVIGWLICLKEQFHMKREVRLAKK